MHENIEVVAVGRRSEIYGGCVTKKERNRGNKRKEKEMSKQREEKRKGKQEERKKKNE